MWSRIWAIPDPADSGTVAIPEENASYLYDLARNVTAIFGPQRVLYYYDQLNRLGTDVYDAEGKTVTSGGLNYAYDFENRLVQQGGLSIVYDGDGNRVSKTVAGVTTQYLVDTQNPTGYAQVLDEVQGGHEDVHVGTGAN